MPPSPHVKMILMGDTYVQRPDPWSAFAPNMQYFEDADVFFCNLETVFADEQHLPLHDTMRHLPRTDEGNLDWYLKAGINVMNVANNPALYHGRDCFVRSLDVLDRAGVIYGGGGRNLTAARKPAIVEAQGTKIAFVCRTSVYPPDAPATAQLPGLAVFRVATSFEPRNRHFEVPGSPPLVHTTPNAEDKDALAEDIEEARREADVVVLSWHWGISPASGGSGELVEYQMDMGRFAIDAGADLVIGHHPHVLQALEIYKGKVIAYSLGNYCHELTSFAARRFDSMLLRCSVEDGRIGRVSFVPGHLVGNGPASFCRPEDAPDVVEYLLRASAPFGTKFRVEQDDVALEF